MDARARLPVVHAAAAAVAVCLVPAFLAWTPARAAAPPVGPDWGAVQSGLAAAHLEARGDPRVAIAVVDTGVDPAALPGRLAAGATFVGSGRPVDLDGHGTDVARIAAAACPRCSIVPVRVLGPGGRGSYGAIAAGIRWAADHGARVVNLSLTTDGWNRDVTDAVLEAERRGALVVAAAGNGGSSRRTFPAATAGVLGVAGTTPDGGRAADSDFGSWVQLAAPGCAPAGAAWFCGTSAAAAYVSGAAGLYLGRYPRAGAREAAAALRRSALPVGYAVAGLLRADAALRLAPLLLLRRSRGYARPGDGAGGAEMMVRYYELPAAAGEPARLLRRLDTGFELRVERLEANGEWVVDPALMHFLAEGAPGATRIDEERAAALAEALGGALTPPPLEWHAKAPLS